jgi:hypothetical protein
VSDETIAARIERLVAEERDLRRSEQADSGSEEALQSDRERRALRGAGADPDDAQVREAGTVERYLQ